MRHCKNLDMEVQLKKNYTKTNYMIVTVICLRYYLHLWPHFSYHNPNYVFIMVSESSILLIQLAVRIHHRWIFIISWFLEGILLLHGSYFENWFHSICWQQSITLYLLLLHRLHHKLNHCEMCDTQHKYLPFKSGLHDTKPTLRSYSMYSMTVRAGSSG